MCQGILVSKYRTLRDPLHAAKLALRHKETAPTANLMIQRAMERIMRHAEQPGGSIAYRTMIVGSDGMRFDGPKRVIDVKRMESLGEQHVYDTKGLRVYLFRDYQNDICTMSKENSIALVRMDDAWGQNSRRTINRLYEKISQPGEKSIDRRLLSMMLWLDASSQILDAQK